jgi:diguanylate cyclase (GGDEF)-like protein
VAWSELPSGWRVALFAPQRPVLGALAQQAASMAGLLVIAVAGALLVAGWQVRRLARATGAVLEALRGMATDGRALPTTRLADMPPELQPVARSIAELAQRFEGANAGLRQALERERALALSLREVVDVREREIAERTAELQVANVELERLSRTDPLTGALNVRGFRSHCDGFVDAAGALHRPLAVLAFDVDHFKNYNDRYGHPAGDRVLRRIASAAQAALRDEGDRVARVGGEEFVVLLSEADGTTAHAIAERMRRAVADLGIPHEGAPSGRLSISLGMVAGEAGELLDTMLQQADEALYRAKTAGRDRVSL